MSSPTPLPDFYVGKEITANRVANFMSNKNNILSTAIGKPDTQSIWYSKAHIQGLLDEIDRAGGDGLRIKLGMYESGHEYEGQLCLLMNTTRANAQNDGHTDVYLEDEPDYGDRSALPRSGFDQKGDDIFGQRDFNFGTPCPPRCV